MKKITGVKVELTSNDKVNIESDPFELEFLDSGQGISNTEFKFSLGQEIGEQTLILKVLFEDSKGKHLLEKSYPINVQERDVYIAILVAAILVLVFISLYMRRKKVSQRVDTEGIKVQDIEGEKLIKKNGQNKK